MSTKIVVTGNKVEFIVNDSVVSVFSGNNSGEVEAHIGGLTAVLMATKSGYAIERVQTEMHVKPFVVDIDESKRDAMRAEAFASEGFLKALEMTKIRDARRAKMSESVLAQ